MLSVFMTCLLAAGAGSIAFWLVTVFKPSPPVLAILGLLAMMAVPPDIAVGLLIGAWVAEAFFLKREQGLIAPNESIIWRRVVQDALVVTSAFLAGLIYMFRRRGINMPESVLLVGLFLSFVLTFCYFRTMAGDIARQIRVKHGYAVGLLSFIPWIFLLTKLGWRFLGLGFFTFLLLPPFLLATADLRLALPTRPHRRRRRSRSTIRLP